MRNVLTIARREVLRLRARFSGRSRPVVLAIVALTTITSGVIYHQELVISKGLYRVGVSPASPPLADTRFDVVTVRRDAGRRLLRRGDIDVYLDGDRLVDRADARSQYASSALRKHLEKQELFRIASEYELDRAFPLRIEVTHLEAENAATAPGLPNVRQPEPGETPVLQERTIRAAPAAPASAEDTGQASRVDDAADQAVRQQLRSAGSRRLPEFKAEFVSENDVIVPSLMSPPVPLAQVLLTFLYVIPILFVSLFFTSSFTEEKVNRKLVILLSAPVRRLDVLLGKMVPYLAYSALVIMVVTVALGGNLLLGLAIFIPVMLFVFAIYLVVALTYRTFKDQTFFSVLALSVVTVYLLGPAMFAGVSDLSYVSPLTLAVQMYRGESFGFAEYLLATTPLYLAFLLIMFVGTRVFNEEYLLGFRPLHNKVAEAVYLALDRRHPAISVFLMSLFLVPVVLMVQLASAVFASNLSLRAVLPLLVIVGVVVEEIAKSAGVVVLRQRNIVRSPRDAVKLALVSALGFLLGEKLLLLVALRVLSESAFVSVMTGAGLLLVPLAVHTASVLAVVLITFRLGVRFYPLGIAAGTALHAAYNFYLLGTLL